jgi:hypothetical protein
MGDYTPVNDIDTFTATAGAGITGGQLVDCTGTGPAVSPSAGVLRPVGVALHDAPSGGRVTVAMLPGAIHELVVVNTSAVVAGGPVVAGAGGQLAVAPSTLAAAAAAGTLIGIALTTATGNAGGTIKARFLGV